MLQSDPCCPDPQKIEGMPELLKLVSACLEALETQLLQNKQLDSSIDMVGAAVAGVAPAELEAKLATYGKGASVGHALAGKGGQSDGPKKSSRRSDPPKAKNENYKKIEEIARQELAKVLEARN